MRTAEEVQPNDKAKISVATGTGTTDSAITRVDQPLLRHPMIIATKEMVDVVGSTEGEGDREVATTMAGRAQQAVLPATPITIGEEAMVVAAAVAVMQASGTPFLTTTTKVDADDQPQPAVLHQVPASRAWTQSLHVRRGGWGSRIFDAASLL